MQFVAWLFLIVQAGIVVASLLGYGIFTSRPDLLIQVDPQARFFTWAFHGFAVGNMLFGGLAVLAESVLRDRKSALMAFVAIYLVSLASELLGTAYGVPLALFLHDPLGSEVVQSRASADSAELVHDELGSVDHCMSKNAGFRAVLLGTCLLIAWDLLLDPAMSRVTSYWVWGTRATIAVCPGVTC
jgi:uncharacterized membrane protein